MQNETGVIKFNCIWNQLDCGIGEDELAAINACRDRLVARNLIGVYPNGIGFGNLSLRVAGTLEFYITGSGTGGIAHLDRRHYARVGAVDLDANTITCRGLAQASSESLTHAAVYASQSSIQAVIHIHNPDLWKRWLFRAPTTALQAAYGTPVMAREMDRLLREPQTRKMKCIVMAGHEEGLIFFGEDLSGAEQVLLNLPG